MKRDFAFRRIIYGVAVQCRCHAVFRQEMESSPAVHPCACVSVLRIDSAYMCRDTGCGATVSRCICGASVRRSFCFTREKRGYAPIARRLPCTFWAYNNAARTLGRCRRRLDMGFLYEHFIAATDVSVPAPYTIRSPKVVGLRSMAILGWPFSSRGNGIQSSATSTRTLRSVS